MKEFTSKKVALITNNVHCERHVQYYSTLEKYFRINGWEVVTHLEADKVIICGCGFHDAMYNKVKTVLSDLKKIHFLEKNVVIMACLTKTHEDELMKSFGGILIPNHKEEELDTIINAEIPYKYIDNVHLFYNFSEDKEQRVPNKLFNIRISEGCLRQCTFCIINKAKGYIKSRSEKEILEDVSKAEQNNRFDVFLMGEDTFAYGIDTGTNIINLIRSIKEKYPKINLYFGYLHIQWLAKYHEEILELCKNKILKELHIGLQHVNDWILNRMGRPADFKQLYKIIKQLKEACPELYLGADILVGFPGETEEIFNELVDFFRNDNCFDKIKHFGYSDVNGAPSKSFSHKLTNELITDRWNILNEVLGDRSYNDAKSEERIDDQTFKMTRFNDYFYCKNTFLKEKGEKNDFKSKCYSLPDIGVDIKNTNDFQFDS